MYSRAIKWETYIDNFGFDPNVDNGLQRKLLTTQNGHEPSASLQDLYKKSLRSEVSTLVASNNTLLKVIDNGFGAQFLKRDRAFDGIFGLGADFDWAMGAALWKLEMEHEELRSILTTLQGPLSPQQIELRKRGEYAYRQGWYEEALIDMMQASEINYLDFAVHFTIGNIYLYETRPADLIQARSYYLNAGKYAAPNDISPYHAGLGYLFAAFVCYLQGDNKFAMKYIQLAIDFSPGLNEAYYCQAKFAAAAGNFEQALTSLEIAIRVDSKYAIKVLVDADFLPFTKQVQKLLTNLRNERQNNFSSIWSAIKTELGGYSITNEEKSVLDPHYSKIEKLFQQKTYFGFLEAEQEAAKFRELMVELRLADREKIRDDAEAIITKLKLELDDYTIPQKLFQNLSRDLTKAVETFEKVETYQDAENALGLASACQRLWVIATDNNTTFTGHTNSIQYLRFTPNSRTLVSCGWDHRIRLWDVSGGKERAIIMGQSGDARATAISPDGSWLATEIYHRVEIRDIHTGERVIQMQSHNGQVRSIAFHPNGKILAAGLDTKEIILWDVKTGAKIDVLRGHKDWIMKIDFNDDGSYMASGSRDKTIRIWNVENFQEINPQEISFEEPIKLGGWAERKVGILAALNADVSLKYEPEIQSAPPGPKRENSETPPHPRLVAVLEGHQNSIMDLAFSPDSSVIASASADFTIRIWDIENMVLLTTFEGHSAMINNIVFNPDGTILASASDDNTIRLWDLPNGVLRTVLEGHLSGINQVAFNPDGTTLASASSDHTVRLWNVLNGRLRTILERHDAQVYTVAFSPDGATLASGGGDDNIHFWGMVVRKEAWQELVQEWTLLEEQERAEKLKQLKAARALKRRQIKWRESGCCEKCGKQLSLLEKMNNHTRCKEHRKDKDLEIENDLSNQE